MRAPWKIVNAGFHDALQPQNVQRTSSNSWVLLHYEMLNFKHYRQWSVVNFPLSEVVLVALLHILFRLCKIIQDLLGKIESCDCNVTFVLRSTDSDESILQVDPKETISGWLKRNYVLCSPFHFFLHLMFGAALLTRDLTRTGSITNGVENIEIYGKNPSL